MKNLQNKSKIAILVFIFAIAVILVVLAKLLFNGENNSKLKDQLDLGYK